MKTKKKVNSGNKNTKSPRQADNERILFQVDQMLVDQSGQVKTDGKDLIKRTTALIRLWHCLSNI